MADGLRCSPGLRLGLPLLRRLLATTSDIYRLLLISNSLSCRARRLAHRFDGRRARFLMRATHSSKRALRSGTQVVGAARILRRKLVATSAGLARRLLMSLPSSSRSLRDDLCSLLVASLATLLLLAPPQRALLRRRVRRVAAACRSCALPSKRAQASRCCVRWTRRRWAQDGR